MGTPNLGKSWIRHWFMRRCTLERYETHNLSSLVLIFHRYVPILLHLSTRLIEFNTKPPHTAVVHYINGRRLLQNKTTNKTCQIYSETLFLFIKFRRKIPPVVFMYPTSGDEWLINTARDRCTIGKHQLSLAPTPYLIWPCNGIFMFNRCLSVHRRGVRGRGGMCGSGGACMAGGHVWQEACVVQGVCGRGACMAGGMHGKGACMAGGVHGGSVWHRCPQQILRDTVNERAARILLECILVL